MKKFTKVCLIAASILFVLSIVCFIAVGLRKQELIRNVGRLQAFGMDVGSDMTDSVLSGEYDLEDFELLGSYSTEEVDSFLVKMDVGNVVIKEVSADAVNVWAQRGNSTKSLTADLQRDGTLNIEEQAKKQRSINFTNWITLKWADNDISDLKLSNVVIEVPARQWEDLDASISLGAIKLYDLSMESVSIKSEAGGVYTEGTLKADYVDIQAELGSVELDTVECGKLTVDADLGNVTAKQITADWLEATLDMGNLELYKVSARQTKANCDLGNMTLQFVGSREDYDISGEVSLGDIGLDGGGRSSSASNYAELNCEMGNIDVTFLNKEE